MPGIMGNYPVGKLNRRVTILKRSDSATGFANETKKTWAVVAYRWAMIVPREGPRGGRQEEQGPQEVAVADLAFRMRYYKGLQAVDYRLQYEGKDYNILFVNDVDTNHVFQEVQVKQVYGE